MAVTVAVDLAVVVAVTNSHCGYSGSSQPATHPDCGSMRCVSLIATLLMLLYATTAFLVPVRSACTFLMQQHEHTAVPYMRDTLLEHLLQFNDICWRNAPHDFNGLENIFPTGRITFAGAWLEFSPCVHATQLVCKHHIVETCGRVRHRRG